MRAHYSPAALGLNSPMRKNNSTLLIDPDRENSPI